jgi:large subunit ribosomal protein L18
MDRARKRLEDRRNRAARVREKVLGTAERPRLCVRRSLNHIYAQIIDDLHGKSIVQVGSTTKAVADHVAANDKLNKLGVAKLVGELVAEKAKEKGIQKVVFDRKGYAFHGRVKALADAARAKGLAF